MTGLGASEADEAPAAQLADQVAQLTEEVGRLRTELFTSRAVSARALARATRLAQLVSALGQLTDVNDILERAVCEVAEQFATDVAVILMPLAGDATRVRLAAQWGIAAKHLPEGPLPRLAEVDQLTSAFPVVAGPVTDFALPGWLTVNRPRQVALGLMSVRAEAVGYLVLTRQADEPFEAADVRELGSVVSRIGLAVDNGQLYWRTQNQLLRLRRLHEVTATLAAIVDPEKVARSLAETVVVEVPVDGAAVYLAGEGGVDLAGLAGDIDDPPPRIGDLRTFERPGVTPVSLGAGTERVGALLLTEVPPAGGEARSFLDQLVDLGGLILEKALLFERIRAQAETDMLTGLPNRALFMDRLVAALVQCRKRGLDLAVIFTDLDGFKEINDTHGHDAGDQLLVQVARRLTGAIRDADTAARLGGDEFVVLCEDVSYDEVSGRIAARVQEEMDRPYRLELPGGAIEVRAGGSIGIGMASDVHYNPSALLRDADAAMYRAKQRRHTPR